VVAVTAKEEAPRVLDLRNFPSNTLPSGTELFRIHRRDPWHYSKDGSGRYDDPRVGTCYTAMSPLGSLLETARGLTLLPPDFVSERRVTRVRLSVPLVVADTLAPGAYAHGYTLSLSSGKDYEAAAEWAGALVEQGFDGLRYLLRHDVAGGEVGVALFGLDKVRLSLEGGSATTRPLCEEVISLAHPYGVRSASVLPGDTDKTQVKQA
jgi:hypothetical protein